jgi:hypothetical protein
LKSANACRRMRVLVSESAPRSCRRAEGVMCRARDGDRFRQSTAAAAMWRASFEPGRASASVGLACAPAAQEERGGRETLPVAPTGGRVRTTHEVGAVPGLQNRAHAPDRSLCRGCAGVVRVGWGGVEWGG